MTVKRPETDSFTAMLIVTKKVKYSFIGHFDGLIINNFIEM